MSTAQKRAWIEMTLSLAGLIFSGVSCYVVTLAGEKFCLPPWVYYIPLINIFHVLSLTGFVLASAKFKTRQFDERELALSRKSQICGFIGVFVYLTSVAMIIFAQNIMAAIPIRLILLLIVSSFYVGTLVISVSFLLMYQTKLKSRLN